MRMKMFMNKPKVKSKRIRALIDRAVGSGEMTGLIVGSLEITAEKFPAGKGHEVKIFVGGQARPISTITGNSVKATVKEVMSYLKTSPY